LQVGNSTKSLVYPEDYHLQLNAFSIGLDAKMEEREKYRRTMAVNPFFAYQTILIFSYQLCHHSNDCRISESDQKT